MLRRWFSNLPLRWRLALWYALFIGVALLLFGGYQYFQLRHSLFASANTTLEIAASQALNSIDSENGLPAFQNTEFLGITQQHLGQEDFVIRLLADDGTLLDSLGAASAAPEFPLKEGFATYGRKDESWQVYTISIQTPDGRIVGWLQTAESLFQTDEILDHALTQLLLGLPLMLLFAIAGGVFLAHRALRPIDQMTHMAQEISANDLSRRIAYVGPDDEIGRLAQTFDRMLDRLQTAFEQQRRFSGDAAHELRTPLTALKGQIEVTLGRVRNPEEYQSVLHNLLSQVDRLIRLSNALLFLSRSDQQRLVWKPENLNLTELLEIIVEQIMPLASEHKLQISTSLPEALPVYGEKDHLVRLFLNLLDNAVKYTPRGGEIRLNALPSETGGVQVQIYNSGAGIPPEQLPHIFERFYRVDADRSSQTGGSGLGLAIAREIVLLHGGQIHAESQPGQGVTFTIDLPGGSR